MSAHVDAPTAAASVLSATGSRVAARRWVAWTLGWLALLAVVMIFDQRLDAYWDELTWRHSSLDYAAVVITKFIQAHTLLLFLGLLVTLDRRLRYRFLYEGVWVLASQGLVSTVLKQLFGRERPETAGEHTVFLGPTLSNASFSFPSGHATAAFALAALMSAYYPRWRFLFIALACLVALARVQLDRHYFGDVLAGALLGWFWSILVIGWLRGCAARKAGLASPPTEEPSPDAV